MILALNQYLAGSGHDLTAKTFLSIQSAQGSQNAVNLTASEPRASGHSELSFHVFLGVEHHAARRLLIPPGPPRFLQIILKRTRHIRVNNKPHVRFINTHAEGVCGRNNAQTAFNKALLHVFFGFRRQSGVKVARLKTFIRKKRCYFFALHAGRAIDYGPSGSVYRKNLFNNLVYMREFLRLACRYNLKHKVGTMGSAVKNI